jgi:hypothetical protein
MSWRIKRLIDKSVKIHGKLEGKVGIAFTTSGGIVTALKLPCYQFCKQCLSME